MFVLSTGLDDPAGCQPTTFDTPIGQMPSVRVNRQGNLDAFSSSAAPPEGAPDFFGSGYTDANGAYWQEINLQALSQQSQFLSISA